MIIQLPDSFAELRPLFDEWYASATKLSRDDTEETAWLAFMSGYAHALMYMGYQIGKESRKRET